MVAAALQETVEIPTEELVDVAAELLVLDEMFRQLNDRQDAGDDAISESLGKLAFRLIATVARDDSPYVNPHHPVAVEAFARALEKRARVFAGFQVDEAEIAAEAAAIRESGCAYGPEWGSPISGAE
jgi:hypothetical protein